MAIFSALFYFIIKLLVAIKKVFSSNTSRNKSRVGTFERR